MFLISGGAGYIGSVLVRILAYRGEKVRVIDNLRYGGETLGELLNLSNFEFMRGDIQKEYDLIKALKNARMVVHLAAIVGDPACAHEPLLATETNYLATRKFYELANKAGVERFIFASTCSNYGKMKNSEKLMDEESTLSPVSHYAETKVRAEQYLLSQPRTNICKPVCLRFSTVYGLSPRIRFDLTVNEFTKEMTLGRELIVYGEQFWRPYCHVYDLAKAVILALKKPKQKVAFEVFNVGDTEENYQKRMIVEKILKFIPEGKVKYEKRHEDPRDYKVSFKKIREILGFGITKTVSDGIQQIINLINSGMLTDPDNPKYKNV